MFKVHAARLIESSVGRTRSQGARDVSAKKDCLKAICLAPGRMANDEVYNLRLRGK